MFFQLYQYFLRIVFYDEPHSFTYYNHDSDWEIV